MECNFVTASSDETPFMALKREVESLRRSTEDMLEIFDLLESAPDAVSLDILRRLKSTRHLPEGVNDASDVLAAVKKDFEDESAFPVKLSNRQLMAGLIPETQSTPEYELMMRCPTTYTMLIPVEVAFINLADLLRPAVLELPRTSSVYVSPTLNIADRYHAKKRRSNYRKSANPHSQCGTRRNSIIIERSECFKGQHSPGQNDTGFTRSGESGHRRLRAFAIDAHTR